MRGYLRQLLPTLAGAMLVVGGFWLMHRPAAAPPPETVLARTIPHIDLELQSLEAGLASITRATGIRFDLDQPSMTPLLKHWHDCNAPLGPAQVVPLRDVTLDRVLRLLLTRLEFTREIRYRPSPADPVAIEIRPYGDWGRYSPPPGVPPIAPEPRFFRTYDLRPLLKPPLITVEVPDDPAFVKAAPATRPSFSHYAAWQGLLPAWESEARLEADWDTALHALEHTLFELAYALHGESIEPLESVGGAMIYLGTAEEHAALRDAMTLLGMMQ